MRLAQKRWALANVLMLLIVASLVFYIEGEKSVKEDSEGVTRNKKEALDLQTHMQKQAQTPSHAPSVSSMKMVSIALPPVPGEHAQNTLPQAQAADNPAPAPTKPSVQRPSPQSSEQEQTQASSELAAKILAATAAEVREGFARSQMRISMPNNARKRQQVTDFLYHCVGIGLAVEASSPNKNAKADAKSGLMPLTNLPSQPSGLLRSVSGEVSVSERRLQRAYAPGERLLRVYPMSFDVVLSQFIAQALNGASLEQFSAMYHLKNNRLYIKNLSLNDVQLAGSWQLFDGYTQSCRL
ncbi:hypothetical protein ACFO4O_05555 [Glaciecola siphonariae]|uniref:Uncharacterized protein n=1 Tax=Glaciecola siphonariae TaxID=521012 RepID=A0ABV9LUT1_9ALTE